MLVFHAGNGLLEVPQQGVYVAEFAIGRALGSGGVEFVGDYESLLVADEGLLQVADTSMRAAQSSVRALLVPGALRFEGDGQVLQR